MSLSATVTWVRRQHKKLFPYWTVLTLIDRPVVVYTNTGVKASMVWFALGLLGYDARIYTWLDWTANSPRLDIALQEAYAKPNPAKIGDVVQITALFEEMNNSSSANQNASETVIHATATTAEGQPTCAALSFRSVSGPPESIALNNVIRVPNVAVDNTAHQAMAKPSERKALGRRAPSRAPAFSASRSQYSIQSRLSVTPLFAISLWT